MMPHLPDGSDDVKSRTIPKPPNSGFDLLRRKATQKRQPYSAVCTTTRTGQSPSPGTRRQPISPARTQLANARLSGTPTTLVKLHRTVVTERLIFAFFINTTAASVGRP
jgi:hypothetical protein